MTPTARVPVHPRQEGDPVPDPLGMRLAHLVLLRDADRLAGLAERLAAGGEAVGRRRAAAIAGHVGAWADSVSDHHCAEDEVLWPVLVGSAGAHVDLSELLADHAALGPALDRLHRAAAAFAARPDEDTATHLAVELADLRDALTEHVAEEEAAVLPLVRRYVSVRDWGRVERQIARRAALSFELPRAASLLRASERRALPLQDRVLLRLGLLVLGPRARRRERLVFGR